MCLRTSPAFLPDFLLLVFGQIQSLKIHIWQESEKKISLDYNVMVGERHFFFNSKKSTLAFVGFYNSETAEMLKLSSWQD